jgi:hypothetical protein
MDAMIEAAYVQAAGTVLASAIAASVGGWFARRWLDQQNLRAKLLEAQADIQFMLEVERQYVEQGKSIGAIPGKNSIRHAVSSNGFTWSGQNTPGRMRSNASNPLE